MRVYFVGAGPGDPDLLTVKAQRLLQNCQCCIWAGSLVNPALLEILPEDADIHDSAKMTLDEIVSVMRHSFERDQDVVRLHTGDPSIFGAISEQMDRLDEQGISYEVIPGVSSFQAAAAALAVELTVPEVSQAVVLGRVSGRTPVPEAQELESLASTQATLCLFLSVGVLAKTCDRLIASYGADCPAAVVYRASWPDQLVVRATLESLAAKVESAGINRTAQVLVGPALKRPVGGVSKLYDSTFTHGYRAGDSDCG
jgi:precorrin-4/cobalt-precorrin-4 C11-methyltransferase